MYSTLKLVERQVAMAEIRRRLEKDVPQPGRYVTQDGIAFGPCLLISRECGSGGTFLAEEIGKRLFWNVFDSKIVDEIAKKNHIHEKLVQNVDERIHSRWEQTWRELLLDDLPDKKYLRDLREVVLTLGHHGNVVLVGRGAQYLLPSQCGLRVRLVAPKDCRAHRVAERCELTLREAYVKLEVADLERATFVKKAFGKDIGLAVNHDIVINTGKFDEEATCQLVLAAIREKLGVELKKTSQSPDYWERAYHPWPIPTT